MTQNGVWEVTEWQFSLSLPIPLIALFIFALYIYLFQIPVTPVTLRDETVFEQGKCE